MSTPTVALIAPDTDAEAVQREVRAVTAALPTSPLVGSVTVLDVIHLLQRPWDVVWLATHGTTEGVRLSDGLLTTAMLIQLVRSCGARLVVMNTCESETAALYISTQTQAAVIATIGPVGDSAALITGSLLATNLAAGMPPRDAFERSRPGDVGLSQRYRFFEGSVGADVESSSLETRLSLMERDIRHIAATLQDLKTEIKRPLPGFYALWGLCLFNTISVMALALWIGAK